MSTTFSDFVAQTIDTEDTTRQAQRAALAESARVGTHMLKLRIARELTQVQLAERSGVAQSEISRIERGLANPTEDTLAKLATALGAHVEVVPDEATVSCPQPLAAALA